MNLEPFQRINPCGYAGMNMTQLADLVGDKALQAPVDDKKLNTDLNIDTIAQKLMVQLQRHMSYQDVNDLGKQLP